MAAVILGLWPGIPSRLPPEPPTDFTTLKRLCHTIFTKWPEDQKSTHTRYLSLPYSVPSSLLNVFFFLTSKEYIPTFTLIFNDKNNSDID